MVQGARAGRISRRMLWGLPVLLVVAALVNLDSIVKIARHQKSPKSILTGKTDGHGGGLANWKVPPDSGAKAAKVTVEIFVNEGDSCHTETYLLGRALSTIDPKRIRVVWRNTKGNPKAIARRDQVKLGCEQGLAVDGQTKFQMPSPTPATKKPKTVYLTKEKVPGMSPRITRDILDQALKAKYKGQGLAMSGPEFEQAIAAAITRLRDQASTGSAGTAEAGSKTGPPDPAKAPAGFGTPH
jgi:hypothetical protein